MHYGMGGIPGGVTPPAMGGAAAVLPDFMASPRGNMGAAPGADPLNAGLEGMIRQVMQRGGPW